MGKISVKTAMPWRTSAEDSYCSRFMIKARRFAVRNGVAFDEFVMKMPDHLKTYAYIWIARNVFKRNT
jgi:hypothetical protein